MILLAATCSEALVAGKELAAQLENFRALVGTGHAQQRHLVAAVEWFCGSRHPSALLKFFPVVLKTLFDAEVVEEEVFLAWSGDLTRNEYSADDSMVSLEALEELRLLAGPFVTWLQEAEEEDDDENDDAGSGGGSASGGEDDA
jgi:translation initiation factor 5